MQRQFWLPEKRATLSPLDFRCHHVESSKGIGWMVDGHIAWPVVLRVQGESDSLAQHVAQVGFSLALIEMFNQCVNFQDLHTVL